MKTEIEINGITYKVGDELVPACQGKLKPRKIMAIGKNAFFIERTDGDNCIVGFDSVGDYKIKKKTIKYDFWVNFYPDGKCVLNKNKENAKYFATDNRLACKNFKGEIEID